jgi:hypothetical protein
VVAAFVMPGHATPSPRDVSCLSSRLGQNVQ